MGTCFLTSKVLCLLFVTGLNLMGIVLLVIGYSRSIAADRYLLDLPTQIDCLKKHCQDLTSYSFASAGGDTNSRRFTLKHNACYILNLVFKPERRVCSPTFPKVCKKCALFKEVVEYSQHREHRYTYKSCAKCKTETRVDYWQEWGTFFYRNRQQKNRPMEWFGFEEPGNFSFQLVGAESEAFPLLRVSGPETEVVLQAERTPPNEYDVLTCRDLDPFSTGPNNLEKF